ncbi:MAG: cell division FtsZ family protein [Prevotellaceae bacterium]|nr:cell division FtsZ family protein [Prevotellaceae bacterium]
MKAEDFLNSAEFEPLNYINAGKKTDNNKIKVIGVGGGGGNAVVNLFYENIEGATLIHCNTDDQALKMSPVPLQILLKTPTETEVDYAKYSEKDQSILKNYYILSKGQPGYGAGNRPIVAQVSAENTINEINEALENASMVFITATMGGGTGTGAAPVIAEACYNLGMLTVGVVTLPFNFEGEKKILDAWEAIEKMSKFVDALLIIQNENLKDNKIIEKYRDALSITETKIEDIKLSKLFKLADRVLVDAVKCVVEIITKYGYMNLDFADVYTTLKGGGETVMDFGFAAGEKRVFNAMENALGSPLLYNFDIGQSTKVLIAFFTSSEHEFSGKELKEITEFNERFQKKYEFKPGMYFDDTLGEKAKVTIIATGASGKILPVELVKEMEKMKKKFYEEDRKPSPLSILDLPEILEKYQNEPAYER